MWKRRPIWPHSGCIMIDWSRVAELQSEVGEDGFAEVAALFLEETDEVVARLRAGEVTQLPRDLHFLKGSALNLGFRDLALRCQEGERMCNAGASGAVDLATLIRLYIDSKAAFSNGLARHSAA